ncbi:MAG: hypothetical protein KDE24_06320, partial [Caldilinea sp.]|nr:hypothetical protein [Caldilinea sp.]
LVGNKIRDDADLAFIAQHGGGIPLAGYFPHDDRVSAADRDGVPVYDALPEFVTQAAAIAALIDSES